jgi:hypothetical protein
VERGGGGAYDDHSLLLARLLVELHVWLASLVQLEGAVEEDGVGEELEELHERIMESVSK